MPCRIRADLGSVTAEFAAVVPAVVLVLAVALGAIQIAGEQLRLQAAAASAARALGRGDPNASEAILAVSPSARLDQSRSGDLVCAHASAAAGFGILLGFTLSATSCALADGQ